MSRRKSIPEYAPATCTFNQLVTIRRDNFNVGDFSILTDAATVWLTEQPMGESPRQTIGIPRPVFNKLIRWYLKPQKRIRDA